MDKRLRVGTKPGIRAEYLVPFAWVSKWIATGNRITRYYDGPDIVPPKAPILVSQAKPAQAESKISAWVKSLSEDESDVRQRARRAARRNKTEQSG